MWFKHKLTVMMLAMDHKTRKELHFWMFLTVSCALAISPYRTRKLSSLRMHPCFILFISYRGFNTLLTDPWR